MMFIRPRRDMQSPPISEAVEEGGLRRPDRQDLELGDDRVRRPWRRHSWPAIFVLFLSSAARAERLFRPRLPGRGSRAVRPAVE